MTMLQSGWTVAAYDEEDRATDRQTVSHYLRNFVGGGNEIHFVPPWVVASDETLDLPELIHITNGN